MAGCQLGGIYANSEGTVPTGISYNIAATWQFKYGLLFGWQFNFVPIIIDLFSNSWLVVHQLRDMIWMVPLKCAMLAETKLWITRNRSIPPLAYLILPVFVSNIFCTCFRQSGTIYIEAGSWTADMQILLLSPARWFYFYHPANFVLSSCQLLELLLAGWIFASMAHWPTSI